MAPRWHLAARARSSSRTATAYRAPMTSSPTAPAISSGCSVSAMAPPRRNAQRSRRHRRRRRAPIPRLSLRSARTPARSGRRLRVCRSLQVAWASAAGCPVSTTSCPDRFASPARSGRPRSRSAPRLYAADRRRNADNGRGDPFRAWLAVPGGRFDRQYVIRCNTAAVVLVHQRLIAINDFGARGQSGRQRKRR